MTTEEYPSLWGFGTTKTFKIPIEHLDFKYIEKCSDVKHLEKILCVLRSGEEGYYPELTELCEKRLQGLAPRSRALRKDKPAATASSFTAEEWEKIDSDIKSWVSEIKKEEDKMHFHETERFAVMEGNLPPVRGSSSCLQVGKEKSSETRSAKKKIPRDYAEWDKFDVEKECSKIDEDHKEKIVVDNRAHLSKIETRIDTSGLTEKEKGLLAAREKEKGNEAFNSGDFEEAVMYYTRPQLLFPGSCPTKIRMQNRAINTMHKKIFSLTMLQKTLSEVERDLKNSEPALKTQSKGKRMVIQEVETSEDEDREESARPRVDGSAAEGNTSFLFWFCRKLPVYHMSWLDCSVCSEILSLPERTVHEAARKYSAAIAQLEPAGSASADDLSILYSNRAACYLKEGNCSGCIEDCNRALELQPFSVKPLLRRALAFETLEQYGKAYVDYKTVLQIDRGIQLANDGVNRITRILMELDGPSWREKLSPIPAVPTPAPVPGWRPAAETTPNQEGDFSGPRPPDSTDDSMFKALKEEGNRCVKDKNYTDALSKYSECLKINNKECAIYTNRALCYLKLCQFEEAKRDCDQALQMDAGNVKACYRRALAHKGLKVRTPPLQGTSMELEEVTRFLNTKDETASLNKGKERKKIEIQEVTECHDREPQPTREDGLADSPASEKGEGHNGPLEHLEELPLARPHNAYEFGQAINAISLRKDKAACAHLLASTAPEELPTLLSNKLEGDTFLLLIQALKNHLVDKDPSLVYQHLLYLSKADRFKMMLTLISKDQKEQLQQLFDALADAPHGHFSVEDVQALKSQYEL
uniref:Sperm-associated antigen 1 n=1 Tax=Oryctolagus cuniculus TaxID=9986 RepID=G1SGC3_RABIT